MTNDASKMQLLVASPPSVTVPDPRVTVVVATYHRPVLLRRALATVCAQTIEDWECLVIGDAVQDETAAVVAEFADSRLTFHNLATNVGDQSGPNNEGVRRARSSVVAFLNQDDLWFPDHLVRCLGELERTGADGVLTCGACARPDGRVALTGVAPSGRLEPWVATPASSWVVQRTALERVGPWRRAGESFDTPPHDWMMRAYRAGADLRLVPWLTVVTHESGARPGSYRCADDEDHRRRAEAMLSEPHDLRVELLTAAALQNVGARLEPWTLHRLARRGARDVVWRVAGSRTMPLRNALRYRRRGGFIIHLRQVRGLPAHGPSAPPPTGAQPPEPRPASE